RSLCTVLGFICLLIGLVFILLPGPAVIFLPLGLALLSLEFNWAKVWLRRCQRWTRKCAVKMDELVAQYRYK
ncbi:PGPGW domain-containing protein, partial [bacterium]|nr:PGPGW domain-containing protein [bacterium]